MAYKDAVRIKIEAAAPVFETVYVFDLQNTVSKETTCLFDLYNTASRESVYLYDLRVLVSKETGYIFDLGTGIVAKETDYPFDLYNLISKETIYPFALYNLIFEEIAYLFGLYNLTSRETDYLFDLYNLFLKETSYRFDLYNLASQETAYLFDLNIPSINTGYQFDLYNFLTRETVYAFELYNNIAKETTYLFKIFKGDERDFILRGLAPIERDAILQGIEQDKAISRFFLLRGLEQNKQSDRDFILKGKNGFERDFILKPRPLIELPFILNAIETLPAGRTKRLALFDRLNLRTTAVYRNPRDIVALKIVYGDFLNVKIPCTPLDRDGYIYHISDRPIQLITKVYVDAEPKTYGYSLYTAYQDETGKSIACVIFDKPQYDKRVSVSCKGVIKPDTGELIENPADLIYDIIVNVQGYDTSSIDTGELARFYSDCLTEGIKIACVINETKTIKDFLDELSVNIHSHWMISDGKSVMRLRWL